MKKTTFSLLFFLLLLFFSEGAKGQIDSVSWQDDAEYVVDTLFGLPVILPEPSSRVPLLREDSLRIPGNDTLPPLSDLDPLLLQSDSMKALLFPSAIPYRWISYRMKMNVEKDGETHFFQLFFVNRIDSLIYLNIYLLGIELIRIVATPDEITLVNKMSYQYYQGDYRLFKAFAGVDITFGMLQSIFNAVDFPGYERNFVLEDVGPELLLISESRCDTLSSASPCLSQRVILDHHLLPVSNWVEAMDIGRSLRIGYARYDHTLPFPLFSTMTVEIPEMKIRVFGDVKSPKFNTPGPTGIKIPAKFTPMQWDPMEKER